MKKIAISFGLIFGLGVYTLSAQVKNAVTTTVDVNGNCGMCKKTIETSGSDGKIAAVKWDVDTKKATITYDSTKTNEQAILKKIAQAGYDNASFRAPDDVYANLHSCCKYDRAIATKAPEHGMKHGEHQNHEKSQESTKTTAGKLDPVFHSYLAVKDALVGTDADKAAEAAKKLSESVAQVDMATLAEKEHHTWMEVNKSIAASAAKIAQENSIESQRQAFMDLSTNLYRLAKDAESDMALYWQFCPMANRNKGAYWVSQQQAIKNPYFGSKMMTCGETKERI